MSDSYNNIKAGLPGQADETLDSENAEFNALVGKRMQEQLESKLQISRIGGGYSKKSVEDFVKEMQRSLLHVKTQLERQIQALAAEKAGVIQECSVLRTQLKVALETDAAGKKQIGDIKHNVEGPAGDQDLQQYLDEINRLKGMLRDYQRISDEMRKNENLLSQKENEIAQLNEKLVGYSNECSALKEKTIQLEKMSENSSAASNKETAELTRQRDEIEGKYQELLRHVKKSNQELEQIRRHLDERELQLKQVKQRLDEKERQLEQKKQQLEEKEKQLEQRKQQLDETETELSQKKLMLDEMETELEQKKQYLDELQTRLENERERFMDIQAQLDLKNKELSEVQAELESQIRARENIRQMKEKELAASGLTLEEWQVENGGEELFESLYMHYSQLKKKVEKQTLVIAEKDELLEQFKILENETVQLRQEQEQAKAVIASLESSFEQAMAELDEQTDTLNRYLSRSRKDRETLKNQVETAKNQSVPYAGEAEAEPEQEPEVKSAQFEEDFSKAESTLQSINNAKKIIHLNDSGINKPEAPGEPKLSGEKDAYQLTKAADM